MLRLGNGLITARPVTQPPVTLSISSLVFAGLGWPRTVRTLSGTGVTYGDLLSLKTDIELHQSIPAIISTTSFTVSATGTPASVNAFTLDSAVPMEPDVYKRQLWNRAS